MDRFLSIRKIALVGFVAGVLSLPYPLWTALQTEINLTRSYGGEWWLIPFGSLVLLLTVLPMAYLWLLHRSQGPLNVPPYAQQVAKAAGLVFLILEIRDGISLAHSFALDLGSLSSLMGVASNVSLILILAALATENPTDARGADPSVRLSKVTRVALITGYALLGYDVFRIALIPVIIWTARSTEPYTGRTPPAAMDLLRRDVELLLFTACMTAIPFVITRILPRVVEEEPAGAE